MLAITKHTPEYLMSIWAEAENSENGIRIRIDDAVTPAQRSRGTQAEIQLARAIRMRKLLYTVRQQATKKLQEASGNEHIQSPWAHFSIIIKDPFDGYLYIEPAALRITAVEKL